MLNVKVALLVGVSEYQPGFKPLPSAIEDIKAMERVLKAKGNFEVTSLENPDSQTMRVEIYQLFANRSSEDVVLFYFSGHGVKDYRRKFYLTTSETTKDREKKLVSPTAVAAGYLQEQMSNSSSERQVLILDCCYSGAMAQGLTVKGEPEIDIAAELGGKGRAILTSSSSTQESYVRDSSKLSIYTHYLVEGIETGAADLDGDGLISADELHQYTSKRVREASPAMTPQFYPVAEGFRIYVATSPQDDPKLKYRKEVEEIVRENEGEIEPLDRFYLDELISRLGISPEEGKTIEDEVLEPFRQLQHKLQRYKEIFSQAIAKNSVITDRTRRKLKRFQEALELRDEDIAAIEAEFIPQLETKPHSKTNKVKPDSMSVFQFEVITVNTRGDEVKREPSQAEYFTENLGNGISLDMVYIPGGKFFMGTEDKEIERLVEKFKWDGFRREQPQHEVEVKSFFMGKFPITQAQWKAIASRKDLKVKDDLDFNPSHFSGNELPVERVSWNDAVEFCQRLSKLTTKEYRLPSEAQWEYACRSVVNYCAKRLSQGASFRNPLGQLSVNSEELTVEKWNEQYNQPFHFGKTITGKLANYRAGEIYGREKKGEYRKQTTPVKSFMPNAFGLYDMHGNVWQWCVDDWHQDYQGAPNDGSAWLSEKSINKVLRGGSWSDIHLDCRSAYRFNLTSDGRGFDIGFRVVCVAPFQ